MLTPPASIVSAGSRVKQFLMEKYIEFKDGEPVATPGQPCVVTPD